jgi:hypothetical protein
MMQATYERENPTGGRPAGLITAAAFEREATIPRQRQKRNMHLMKKPLRDHLTGLLNRLDLLEDGKIRQAIIDSTMFVLIEVARLDQVARRLL